MRTGMHFPFTPVNEPRPEVFDELYDDLWDLNLANIRLLVRAAAYRSALAYVADGRREGMVGPDGVTFAFYEGEGCSLFSTLGQHWFTRSMHALEAPLRAVALESGYRLGDLPRVPYRFVEIDGRPLRVVTESGSIELWSDVGGPVDFASLEPAARRKIQKLADDGSCGCELCRKLARGVAPLDVEARRAAPTTSADFTSVSKALRHVRQAKVLCLYERGLSELPVGLSELAWLECLLAWSNPIRELPAAIGQLGRLRQLHLRDCQLRALPAEIGRLRRLEDLNIDGSRAIVELPEEMAALTSLKALDLGNLSLTRIPDWFERLESLERLRLYGMPLQELPYVLTRLPRLKHLDIRDTAPTGWSVSAPGWEPLWTGRKEALGRGEGDAWLEFPFDAMPALETLELRCVSRIPASVLASRTLTSLDVNPHYTDGLLEPMPEGIGRLQLLERLSYGCSRTTSLPDALWSLRRLQTLAIGPCDVTEVPDGIGELAALQLLYIRDNPIVRISDRIARCTALTDVFMTHIAMTSVPEAIRGLPNLKTLSA